MAAKVNYQFQKAERERAKLAKKEAKRREAERDQTSAEPAPAADPSPDKVTADA